MTTPCSFCQRLAETKKVTVTYHQCESCQLEDFTVERVGTFHNPPVVPSAPPAAMPIIGGLAQDPRKPPEGFGL